MAVSFSILEGVPWADGQGEKKVLNTEISQDLEPPPRGKVS